MGGSKETIREEAKKAYEVYRLLKEEPFEEWEDTQLASWLPNWRHILQIFWQSLKEKEVVKECDLIFLKNCRKIAYWVRKDGYYERLKNSPLEEWYSHPDLIAEGKYPAELLPEWLREEYRKLHESGG